METSKKGEDGTLAIDRAAVQAKVAVTKDYDGASGKITFTSDGDLVANIGIYVSENGKYKQIKTFILDGDKLIEVK